MHNRSFEELYPAFENYKPFVERVFKYLNGYINPSNPCRLTINLFSNANYAEFAKPDNLIVYLMSIINNFYGEDDKIKQIILMVIAHELCHSEQDLNMLRYSKDPYYKESVENQNEGYSEQWINLHAAEIYSLFGIKFHFSDFAINNIQPAGDDYQKISIRNHYLFSIMDVIYRNDNALPTLSDLFDSNANIVFHIDDSYKVLIKFKGEYNPAGLYLFNSIINRYCRKGICITYFNIETKITKVKIFDENGIDLHILTSNKYFKPIDF